MNTWQKPNSNTNRCVQAHPTDVLAQRNKEWARHWFAGLRVCPHCGGDNFRTINVREDERLRYDTFKCNESGCTGCWQVELVEMSISATAATVPDQVWIELDEVIHSNPDEAP